MFSTFPCYLCCRHTIFTCACPVFYAGTADSCKDGACDIMPYTENSTRKSCQWIGCKVSCCQRNCQSAVLHAHFNSYSCCRVYSTWKIFAARSPSIIPQKLWIATTPRTRTPQLKIFSALIATIPPMIITMATTEINGITSETLST